MAIYIKDLIEEKIFPGIRLAAGKSGDMNEIRWINIMEILDTPDSVAPYELLFTTGYGLDNAALHKDLLQRLASRGIPGIVIQTGLYVDSLPQYLAEEADRIGFPILTIPENITFSSILHTMMQLIESSPRQIIDNSSLQFAERFVRNIVRTESSRLFEQPENAKSKEAHIVRLMLLEAENPSAGLSDGLLASYAQISSYLQSSGSAFYSQELPENRLLFIIGAPEKEGHSLLYGLNIKLTLLSEQYGLGCFVGSVELSQDSDPVQSVRNASEAIRVLRDINARRGICPFEQIKFIRLLGHMHEFDHSAVLDNRPLQKLLDYDRHEGTGYTQTLRVYLSNNCGITATAGYLFIHRHTLLKRLEKISEISGLNLDDWYTRLYMSVNLLFHDYFVY